METRYVRNEMDLMKRMAAFISELLYAQEDLQKKLNIVENGNDRLTKILDETSELVKDLVNIMPDNQKRQFRNALKDYSIQLVPKLTPGSPNVLITKEQAKALVELAQERCANCVEMPYEAEKCPVYQVLNTVALPDSYDINICPYSIAEWAD